MFLAAIVLKRKSVLPTISQATVSFLPMSNLKVSNPILSQWKWFHKENPPPPHTSYFIMKLSHLTISHSRFSHFDTFSCDTIPERLLSLLNLPYTTMFCPAISSVHLYVDDISTHIECGANDFMVYIIMCVSRNKSASFWCFTSLQNIRNATVLSKWVFLINI